MATSLIAVAATWSSFDDYLTGRVRLKRAEDRWQHIDHRSRRSNTNSLVLSGAACLITGVSLLAGLGGVAASVKLRR